MAHINHKIELIMRIKIKLIKRAEIINFCGEWEGKTVREFFIMNVINNVSLIGI